MADLRLGSPWTDHMVLQRDRQVPLWGWGPPGAEIELDFGGRIHGGSVGTDGRWVIRFDPGPACSAGVDLKVRLAGRPDSLVLRDVLVGDIWLCAGQSNMELGLGMAEGGVAAAADHPAIRLLLLEKDSAPVPQRAIDARWRRCTPDSALSGGWGGFSAVAYYFARRLQAETGAPVGLIQAAYGGSKIHPFIHPACLRGHPALADFGRELRAANQIWRAERALSGRRDPAGDLHPFAPFREWNELKPATVWNAMIHPLLPFALRGVLWYQGESDVAEPAGYPAKLAALVRGFRRSFGDRGLPLYFAQIAPWRYGEGEDLLAFWAAQYEAARLTGSGLVTTVDLGDLNDIHPARKQPVGERFAALALARTYGRADIPAGGPQLTAISFGEAEATLSFATFGGGLTTLDGREPAGFELAGEDGAFHHARAVIAGEQVILRCPQVDAPRRVRHTWQIGALPNLSDASAIPALPFASD